MRNKCKVEGCDRLGRNKGQTNGVSRYGSVCQIHHKKGKLGLTGLSKHFENTSNIENKKCERCGWDKAPCDRHRIDPKLGYVEGNVEILCPNCHRIETLK